jgi:WhiB family transcriptional regulator, redox-sensing transcriptional regulator
MTSDRLISVAARLDRLTNVPTDVLAEIVMRDGACVSCYGESDLPRLTGNNMTDRTLAARICAGCPVQDQCLELELRWAGKNTVGVWGALSEQDRQALYPLWRARGHAEARETDESGEGVTADESPLDAH